MTERLYYQDSYLSSFTAQVLRTASNGTVAYLDRTAFYPASGGQPFDNGLIAGVPVIAVVDEGQEIAHQLAAPVSLSAVDASIDWKRRFDHMQQHSGQHLLSAIFAEHFGLHTVSFHLGPESSTIDLEAPAVALETVREAELRANQVVFENRPVTVEFHAAAGAQGLRKPSEREGTLRVIVIEGLDRSACGGTHVRATGEIGPILIRKIEKIRQTVRLEFLCGARAVRRARSDYESLARAAQAFSAPLDEVPALINAQLETARAADKTRRKLELDLAINRGRELYESTPTGPDGLRRAAHVCAKGSMEELRAVAQSFTSHPKAVFLALVDHPPSVLYAASEDSGINAGQALKQALMETGGRGGGSARIAQGTVPDPEGLADVLAKLPRSS
jgi:alanyl-tRNA synthetase